jgi:hypothetical protein
MSNGIYLQCDQCGATLGGEEVTRGTGKPPLNQWDRELLRELAQGFGWTHKKPDSDYCKECTQIHLHSSQ